ncbi:MAG: hypothetical protein QNJ54_34435 [Prochloraceae cyanobacterium]|nr:hypothetical protein [Prochloraceae cyanobacterium]
MLMVNEVFSWGKLAYKNAAQLRKSKCRIRIYKNGANTVVIVTELADNEGRSVTNDAEKIIELACQMYGISFEETIWIEHYTEGCKIRGEEHFDRVFLIQNRAAWQTMSIEGIEKLIGVDPRLNRANN